MRTNLLWLLVVIVQVMAVLLPSSPAAGLSISFQDVTRRSGLPTRATHTWGAAALDYDRDGNLDLLLNRHYGRAGMFERRGRRFATTTPPSLHFPDEGRRTYDRHHCSWGEANGDGRVDLYCLSGAERGLGSGSNQLLLQTGKGLTNAAEQYGLRDEMGRGRSLNWLDYDGDGDLDIFLGNGVRGEAPSLMFRNDNGSFQRVRVGVTLDTYVWTTAASDWDNDGDTDLMVFRNHGHKVLAFKDVGSRFRRVSVRGVTSVMWTSGTFGDYNGDGWTDLQVTRGNRTRILKNRRGRLTPVGEWGMSTGRMSGWIDVENDGDLDSVVSDGRRARDLLLVNRSGRFTPTRTKLGRYRGGNGDALAVTDFNRDGRVDVLLTNGYFGGRGRPVVLANRTRVKRWVAVRLHGTPTNPLGYGAHVTVRSSARRWNREVTDGGSGPSQHDVERLHFGIGSARGARVVVRWREGSVDCVNARAGRVVEVTRGAHPC